MFTTLEGSFEPTVMFFGLTNSLAMFQTMMNKILWDLINTGKVASFIDNVIVGIEGEKEHDEVVEKVVKQLAENNLYVKGEESNIFRSSDWTRENKDGEREGERDIGMADSERS